MPSKTEILMNTLHQKSYFLVLLNFKNLMPFPTARIAVII